MKFCKFSKSLSYNNPIKSNVYTKYCPSKICDTKREQNL